MNGDRMKLIATCVLLLSLAGADAQLLVRGAHSGPPVVASAGGGACPSADYTPGGADGQGGCFPDASTTGPTGSLTSYSSPCTPSAGATIVSRTINCNPLVIANDNITITNSKINGQIVSSGGSDLTLTDVEIDATPTPGTYLDDYAVQGGIDGLSLVRVEIYGARSGIDCDINCSMTDSYSHGISIQPGTDWHASASRAEQFTTFLHNSLACDFSPPTLGPDGIAGTDDDGGCSADLTGYPDFAPIQHNHYENNLLIANESSAYCGYASGGTSGKPFSNHVNNATFIEWINNVFQRGDNDLCGSYGAISDYVPGRTGNVCSGNKWDDGDAYNCD